MSKLVALKRSDFEVDSWMVPGSQSERKKSRKKRTKTWEEKFALLREFKRTYGHCLVPPMYFVGGVNLGGCWISNARNTRNIAWA